MIKQIHVTAEGLKKMEQELEYLKTEKRKEVAERIKEARSFGDLSENSEYDEAKDEQARVEAKIADLENKLKHTVVIDTSDMEEGTVYLGSTVKLFDVEFDEEILYTIVGSTEADPKEFKISNESPMGIALIGKKIGDTVDVVVGDETFQYKILDVNH